MASGNKRILHGGATPHKKSGICHTEQIRASDPQTLDLQTHQIHPYRYARPFSDRRVAAARIILQGVFITLIFLFTGCASLASLADTLNERQIQSCLYYQGIVGGGIGATANVQVSGITATGGAALEDCMAGKGGTM